jgi:hypothetical protein
MIEVASLSVAGIGAASFTNFLNAEGFINNFQIAQEEEMTSEGVAGRRWRLVSLQFEPFTVETVAAAANYAQAVNLKQLYASMQRSGALATLVLDAGGRTYIGRDVKIRMVTAMPINGELAMSDRTIADAHCLATWSLEFTQEGDD